MQIKNSRYTEKNLAALFNHSNYIRIRRSLLLFCLPLNLNQKININSRQQKEIGKEKNYGWLFS